MLYVADVELPDDIGREEAIHRLILAAQRACQRPGRRRHGNHLLRRCPQGDRISF